MHPEARPTATARTERRPRRIPPRRHRPKPPQARQADPGAGVDRCDLKRRGAHEHDRDRRFPPPQYFKTDFFNGIAPKPSFIDNLAEMCTGHTKTLCGPPAITRRAGWVAASGTL